MRNHTKHLGVLALLFLHLNLFSNGIGIVDASSNSYLLVEETHTSVEINNQIAIVTSRQVFRNQFDESKHFQYAFPLNENANPIDLRWFANGVWRTASVISEGQDTIMSGGGNGGGGGPGLPNELQAYLGNTPMLFTPLDSLPSDSLIIFEITYVELLPYYLGKVNYTQTNDFSALQGNIVLEQRFEFSLNSNRNITTLDLLNTDDEVIVINGTSANLLYESFESISDINFEVEYELFSDGLGLEALSTFIPDSLFNCDDFGKGYATFIIEPESSVNTEVIDKNFTLVIDRSGSMSGDKIRQARDAAKFIVSNLNFGDKFNIIDFSSDIKTLFEAHLDYNLSNEATALNYINSIFAAGSTNISGTLYTAIDQFDIVDQDKANIILFFTDGEATSGITQTEDILDHIEDKVNMDETEIFLFTFGIGTNASRPLLSRLAAENNGLARFINPQNLEEEVTQFFLSINNPVLLNTQISFQPDLLREIYPNPLPNLYKGEQLILSGRYDIPQTINVRLEGNAFNVPVTYDFEVTLSDSNDLSKSVLPKIWAKQKLDALELLSYIPSSNQDSLEQEIDSISICYGVVDVNFTSFNDDGTVTSIEETFSTGEGIEIKILPTLFYDRFVIQFQKENLESTTVRVYLSDAQGKLLRQIEASIDETNKEIVMEGLEDLAKGIYFVTIEMNNQLYTFKVFKQ